MENSESCIEHINENVTAVCYTCKFKRLCIQCAIKGDHKDHEVIYLKDIKHELQKLLSKKPNGKSKLQGILEELESGIDENDKSSSKLCEEIDKRREMLKRDIDNLANNLITECKQTHKKCETFLKNRHKNVSKCLSDCEYAIDSTDHMKQAMVLRRTRDLIKRQNVSMKDKGLCFTPGKLNSSTIEKTFGNLGTSDADLDVGSELPVCSNIVSEETPSCQSSSEEDPENASDYYHRAAKRSSVQRPPVSLTFELSKSAGISFICPCLGNGMMWVKCQGEKLIHLVDGNGHTKSTVEFEKGIRGMTMDSGGQLYVACYEDQCILKVTEIGKKYKISTAFSTEGLMPYHLCTTTDDNFLITLLDEDSYKLKDHSCRILIKYNKQGQKLASAEFDENNQRLFVTPDKVRVNKVTGDVVVINRVSSDSRHLVVLDKNLKLKYRLPETGAVVPNQSDYSHPHAGLGYKKFVPSDVCIQDNGDILMASPKRKCVYVLNSSGQYKSTIAGHSDAPWSIAVLPNGLLWIGYKSGTIAIFNYGS